MNLELHGCVGVSAANKLCDRGRISPVMFVKPRGHGEALVFEAIEMELQAILQIGRVSEARATKHPFVAEAFVRMQIDQFANDDYVVFDHDHPSRCDPEMLEMALPGSARRWRDLESPALRDSYQPLELLTREGFPSVGGCYSLAFEAGEETGVAIAIEREDHTATELRRLACRAASPAQARRMLAIALVMEGSTGRRRRGAAAWTGRR